MAAKKDEILAEDALKNIIVVGGALAVLTCLGTALTGCLAATAAYVLAVLGGRYNLDLKFNALLLAYDHYKDCASTPCDPCKT